MCHGRELEGAGNFYPHNKVPAKKIVNKPPVAYVTVFIKDF